MEHPLSLACKSRIDYSEIDDGIRNLIRDINQISFVHTLGCCQGHMRDRYSNNVPNHPTSLAIGFPDKGYTYLFGGYIDCCINFLDTRAIEFLTVVKALSEKHRHLLVRKRDYNVIAREEHGEENSYPSNIELFTFRIDISDLMCEEVQPGDNLFVEAKKYHHVRKELAVARLDEHSWVWNDLSKVVGRYV